MKKPKISKKPKYNEDDHKLHARIKSIVPEENDKCALIITLLGASANLAEFIAHKFTFREDIPVNIKYALAIIASNLMVFMSGNKECEFIVVETKPEDDLGEQTEERVYRKMKYIVEELYKSIQEKDG